MDAPVGYRLKGPVDDVALSALSALHDEAFGEPGPVLPWNARLHHQSVTGWRRTPRPGSSAS